MAGGTKAGLHSQLCLTQLLDLWLLHGSEEKYEKGLSTKSRGQEFRQAAQRSFTSFAAVTVQLTGRHILFYFHTRHMLVEMVFSEGA